MVAEYGSVKTKRTKGLLGLQLNSYNATYYDYHEVDTFINELYKKDYECIQIDEGCLGSGDWICVAPDDSHCFVIRERFVSSWNCTHTIEKANRVSKEIQEELDRYYNL